MSLNTALAISLGVLGAVATWLFLGPLGGMLAIWAAFIAWGCYYHSGGKETGLQSTIICTAVGAVVGGITLKLAGMSIGLPETMWTAMCVGLGVAAMVLLANVPMFASIPAQVYGFASTVAYAMLKGGSVTEASMANPVVVIILSMILGAVFGYVSEKVAGMLVGAGDHRAAAKV
jgi:tetrahydromethanopterin S-methyltransferase subunit C